MIIQVTLAVAEIFTGAIKLPYHFLACGDITCIIIFATSSSYSEHAYEEVFLITSVYV